MKMWLPFHPRQVAPDVYQLPAPGCKVTAILEKDGVVLIDAGSRFSTPVIARGLKAIGRSLRDVRLIALTHYHPDHTGGVEGLVRASGAEVTIHHSEAPYLTGDMIPPSPFRLKSMAAVMRPILPLAYSRPVRVTHLLNEGDGLPGSTGIRAVHTPGHTAGSMCYYLPQTGVLMVGDSLQRRFRRLSGPAWLFTHDTDEARRSIANLSELSVETVVFSHFSTIRSDGGTAIRRLAGL
jgi:glyoxylase-like metal-dependent hydrolase (beta-lactamase superfamily II)